MNKKGFTLIELLAVIVVLVIIALIAIPSILGVIEKARKGASKASAVNYINAIENYMVMHEVDNGKYPIKLNEDETYQVSNNTYEIAIFNKLIENVYAEEETIYINNVLKGFVKGAMPKKGIVTIGKNNRVANAILEIEHYQVECTGNRCNVKNANDIIDITPPSLTITDYEDNTSSLKLNYLASDQESDIDNVVCYYGETNEYGSSVNGTKTSCTLTGLKENTNYFYKVVAKNKANLTTEIKGDRQSGVYHEIIISETPNENTWTNTSKMISITGSAPSSQLQYKRIGIDSDWQNYSNSFEITENMTITARLYNGETEISTSNHTINTIDKVLPECSLELTSGGYYVTFSSKTDNNQIESYGLSTNSNPVFNNASSSTFANVDEITLYGYVKDRAGNINSCSLTRYNSNLISYDKTTKVCKANIRYRKHYKTCVGTDKGNVVYRKATQICTPHEVHSKSGETSYTFMWEAPEYSYESSCTDQVGVCDSVNGPPYYQPTTTCSGPYTVTNGWINEGYDEEAVNCTNNIIECSSNVQTGTDSNGNASYSSTIGEQYVSCSSYYKYEWSNEQTQSNVASCNSNVFNCDNSSYNNVTYTSCSPNYQCPEGATIYGPNKSFCYKLN